MNSTIEGCIIYMNMVYGYILINLHINYIHTFIYNGTAWNVYRPQTHTRFVENFDDNLSKCNLPQETYIFGDLNICLLDSSPNYAMPKDYLGCLTGAGLQNLIKTLLHHTIPYSKKVENWSKSDYVINAGPIIRTETLAGQRHRCGLAWVFKGLGCEGSPVQFRGKPTFYGVSVKTEIGYIG